MTSNVKLNRDLDFTMVFAIGAGIALWAFVAKVYPGTVSPEQASTLSLKEVEGMIRAYHIVAGRVLPFVASVFFIVAFGIFRYRRKKKALEGDGLRGQP